MVGWVLATWASFDVLRWQRGLAEAMAGRDAVLRPLQVSGWHDPAVLAMARRVDGMIAYPANWGPPPESIVAATKLVVVDRASEDARVPSLVPNPPGAVDALCAALRGWGRTRIAWVGDPGMDPVVVARRARWLACAGGGPDLPRDRATVAAAVRAGVCDALLAATMPDALVALRAARDAGARIPDDLAVAVVNDEGLGDSLVPALCAPRSPDLGAWLAGALDWFAGRAWTPPPIPDALTIDRRETA